METQAIITWSEIKALWMDAVSGKAWPWKESARHSCVTRIQSRKSVRSSWEGGSVDDTTRWIQEGYESPNFKAELIQAPKVTRRRARWSAEEGDVDAGRLRGGYDDFYLDSVKRESRAGLRVTIAYCFDCSVRHSTIEEYGVWVAGLLSGLEARGYDLTVDIDMSGMNVPNPGLNKRYLRVKKSQELSAFKEWSALFSPTGYRHLVFLAKVAAESQAGRVKKDWTDRLGHMADRRQTDVQFDAATRTLAITPSYHGRGNLTAELNTKTQETGLLEGK